MKYRVKKTPTNRWVVQVQSWFPFCWINVPRPDFGGDSYFEFRETAEEYKQWLENNG